MNVPDDLQPGDVLFYRPSSLVGVFIAFKTWTWLSHVEAYIGRGRVIAARTQGVNVYVERIDKSLVAVRRPIVKKWDASGAYHAVSSLLNKPYDVSAFWAFFNPFLHHYHSSRICSSVVTLWLRGGGCEPFNPAVSEDDIAPAQLWQTDELNTVWEK